ncbi:MAG: hypothetical protein A4E48_01701 [Methanosaeta sp. PtaU1.Bin060]|nr:MAG: hypothetical protein A4E48_01701 [Methanosaeta sp. PtaU1.Bin060]
MLLIACCCYSFAEERDKKMNDLKKENERIKPI